MKYNDLTKDYLAFFKRAWEGIVRQDDMLWKWYQWESRKRKYLHRLMIRFLGFSAPSRYPAPPNTTKILWYLRGTQIRGLTLCPYLLGPKNERYDDVNYLASSVSIHLGRRAHELEHWKVDEKYRPKVLTKTTPALLSPILLVVIFPVNKTVLLCLATKRTDSPSDCPHHEDGYANQ